MASDGQMTTVSIRRRYVCRYPEQAFCGVRARRLRPYPAPPKRLPPASPP